MWIERKEIQENNEFENQFKDEIENKEIVDQKTFKEITNWKKFDENLTKEENFKNAFNESIDDMIEKKLKNIDEKTKEELKILQKKENEWKWINDLIENFKEIKELLNTRDWATWIKTKEQQRLDNQEQEKKENKDKQDFMNKLKEAILENFRKEQEKIQETARKIEKIRKEEQKERTKKQREKVLEQWPSETIEKS